MLTLDEAQSRLMTLAPAMDGETVPVEDALGRVLAGDLSAARTQPPADLSAMDGYAVCGAGPWALVGESRAGAPFAGLLVAGEAVRISTGAHMPQGADRVLIQEVATVAQGTVYAATPPAPAAYIRRRGFDFALGAKVLEAGTRIGPAQLALALAAGHASITVRTQPRVAVLDSGDELATDPAQCGPGQIPASNGAMIAAMLRPWVGRVQRVGPAADDREALAAALAQADGCDVLVTSGGASAGDHDLVQAALQAWGAQIAFWKVAIRPGKPLLVATRETASGRQVILGLPGNPVSSYVTAWLFAVPLVRAAMGERAPLPRRRSLRAAGPLPAAGDRRTFLRAVSDGEGVRLAGPQDSSALLALAAADCLIDRPAGSGAVGVGEVVHVLDL